MASIYDTPADLNLINTYVPLPFEEMSRGLEARQGRYDVAADTITNTANALGQVKSAGLADQQYMASLKEQYAKEVVDEFQYGQVDLTDPNVSSRLRRKINDYANKPELQMIAANAEIYPTFKESVQRAMIEQPNNVHNYADALRAANMFEEYGTAGVGSLSNIAIAQPSDVPGTLNSILSTFKERSREIENDLGQIRTRGSLRGVDLGRIYGAFNLNEEGKAANGVPGWFLNNEVGQEMARKVRFELDNSEDVTEDNYNEKYQEEMADLYESTITNYLQAYAYDQTEQFQGLGSIMSDKYDHLREIPLTTVAGTSARGMALDYAQFQTDYESSTIDGIIMNKLENIFDSSDMNIENAAGEVFLETLTEITGDGIAKNREQVQQAVDQSKEEFIRKTSSHFKDAFLQPFTGGIDIVFGADKDQSGPLAGKVSNSYQKSWGNMIDNYLESMYDAIVMTSEHFAPVRQHIPGDKAEEANFTLITAAERYNSQNGPGEFENLPVAEKTRQMNKQVFDHMAQLRQVHIEVPAERSDAIKYNESLGSSVFGVKNASEPLIYEAKENGDAPGILAGTTAFTVDGEEFKFADEVKEGQVISLQGRLAANNPYGPGFFMATVGGETVFFEGSQAEINDQYLPWNLHGYSRSFNGISDNVFTTKIGSTPYEMRTVDDKTTGQLRIDYRKPGSETWKQYPSDKADIMEIYEDLTDELK